MTESKYKEIVQLLKNVDFGPDFQPIEDKMEPSLHLENLSDDNQKNLQGVGTKNPIDNIVGDEADNKESEYEQFGNKFTEINRVKDTFRQNIFGLDHAALIKKIAVSKQKCKSRPAEDDRGISLSLLEAERMVGEIPVDYSKLLKKNWKSKIKIGKKDYTVKDYMKNYGQSSLHTTELDDIDEFKYEADDDEENEKN